MSEREFVLWNDDAEPEFRGKVRGVKDLLKQTDFADDECERLTALKVNEQIDFDDGTFHVRRTA
jgi:hypothetical protein